MDLDSIKGRLVGVFAFPITPFTPEDWLTLDVEGMRFNIRFLLKNGVYNIVPCGGTGEIDYITEEEHMTATKIVLEEAKSRALVVPTLPGSIKRAIDLADYEVSLGAEVFLAFPPQSDERGILRHYRALSERVDGAIIMYNRKGDWSLDLISKMASIEKVVGIKDELSDLGTFSRMAQLVGDRLALIGGINHMTAVVSHYFMVGMRGFTCGLINFMPRFELEIYEAVKRKDYKGVKEIQMSLSKIFSMRKKFGSISMVKEAMNMGDLRGGSHRPPQPELTDEQRLMLREELERLNLL